MGAVICTQDDKARVEAVLPDWFNPVEGFRFLYGGSPAIVLGWGAWREAENFGSLSLQRKYDDTIHEALWKLTFRPPTLCVSYLYKGEWHLTSVENILDGLEPNNDQP